MAMTRKHYRQFAEMIADVGAIGANATWLAPHVADILAADNPRFDRARFFEACGVSDPRVR